VPYKARPAMTHLMGGQIPMLFVPRARGGAVKTARSRARGDLAAAIGCFPDGATMDELGLKASIQPPGT